MVPPEMKVETPPKYSWIEESKLVRRLFLEDRILRLTPIARRCLRIDPGTELLVEPMKQYRSSGSRLIARKDSFKITVLDKQYHFSVKVDTGRGYAIASQKATMDLIRQKVSGDKSANASNTHCRRVLMIPVDKRLSGTARTRI